MRQLGAGEGCPRGHIPYGVVGEVKTTAEPQRSVLLGWTNHPRLTGNAPGVQMKFPAKTGCRVDRPRLHLLHATIRASLSEAGGSLPDSGAEPQCAVIRTPHRNRPLFAAFPFERFPWKRPR